VRQKPKTALAVWQPAERMLVLHAWLDGNTPRHDLYAVLGVESTERFVDDAEAEAETRHDALILVDGAVQPLRDAERFYLDGSSELIVADWPPGEDETRLTPLVARLHDRLRRRDEAKKAAKAVAP
jgi:hypothetical protein